MRRAKRSLQPGKHRTRSSAGPAARIPQRSKSRWIFASAGTFTQKLHIRNVGEYIITGTYDELVEPEKIVYHVNLGPATTQVALEFIAQGSQTKVILKQVGFPDENLSRIVAEGTTESLDRLDQVLSGQPV
jgi:uncharacterized protein YndB with AHSA1/START domain